MNKLTQTGVGLTGSTGSMRDDVVKGTLFAQADGDGSTTYRVLGRIDPDAEWQELRAAGTESFIGTIQWVAQVTLEVTAGSGTVSLYVGDK